MSIIDSLIYLPPVFLCLCKLSVLPMGYGLLINAFFASAQESSIIKEGEASVDPLSPYHFFTREHLQVIKAENPGIVFSASIPSRLPYVDGSSPVT